MRKWLIRRIMVIVAIPLLERLGALLWQRYRTGRRAGDSRRTLG